MSKRFVRPVLGLLVLAQVLLGLLGVWYLLSNHTNGKLVSGGETRRYLLHVPPSYDPAVPTPLVITFHGFAQWPAHQSLVTHWDQVADEQGFLSVFPEGTSFPRRWRTSGRGDDLADITFVADLIDELEEQYNIDPARVYANGLSNGGGMSFVVSCALSERIAAIGTVAGAYLYPWERCTPARPVPAIVFHGTADRIVPFGGGPSRTFELPFPVVTDWVATLAQRNGCDGPPVEIGSQGEVRTVAYPGCEADVVLYTIEGGGHTWPGGGGIPAMVGGHTTRDIDATREMWAFFQAHALER